jgi:hypothetical protein
MKKKQENIFVVESIGSLKDLKNIEDLELNFIRTKYSKEVFYKCFNIFKKFDKRDGRVILGISGGIKEGNFEVEELDELIDSFDLLKSKKLAKDLPRQLIVEILIKDYVRFKKYKMHKENLTAINKVAKLFKIKVSEYKTTQV